jgi:hypothetical protein
VDDLAAVVKGYNNTVHSSLGAKGRTPESVMNSQYAHNDEEVLLDQVLLKERKKGVGKNKAYRNPPSSSSSSSSSSRRRSRRLKPYKFKTDQIVRVSNLKNVFTRAYDTHYSTELFRVKERFRRQIYPCTF